MEFEFCDVVAERIPVASEQIGVAHVPEQDEGIIHDLKSLFYIFKNTTFHIIFKINEIIFAH